MLSLANVGNMRSSFAPLDIVATCIMVLVMVVLIWLVFFSRYIVKENGIIRYIGFFRNFVKYEDIYLMRVNSKKTTLIIYVKADEKKAQIKDEASGLNANAIQVFIKPDDIDEFINAVKTNSKELAFEIVD